MRQSAPGNDQRIDLVVGQSGTTKLIDGICGQTVLHKPDEVLVRSQPVHTEKLLDTVEEIRLLGLVSDGRLRQWRSSRLASCSLLYGNLLRARNRQRYQRYHDRSPSEYLPFDCAEFLKSRTTSTSGTLPSRSDLQTALI